ncbi:hypothetical protein BD289DRAFT_364059 [Coniella lustricola]|uniref:RGS domain-containing protein n=1 Tax=Coniella lustricola TaxID=2025994 RepID=A0A2T3AEG8_9PEZI|nr:hypothetical protein BD289DRAFT_364059 [Coniella lustricola]
MAVSGSLRLWYKRPEWRDIEDYTRMVNDETLVPRHRPKSPSQAFAAIPSRLSLDRVLENKTCSPMSLHDFFLYLKHIEHSSENLEFYLWYMNYNANFPDSARDRISKEIKRPARTHSVETDISSIGIAHLESPCIRAAKERSMWSAILPHWLRREKHTDCADGFCRLEAINESRDVERQPSPDPSPVFGRPSSKSSTQEHRAELNSAVTTFLLPGAEKELNISHALRQSVLQNIEHSSDPRHLKPIADHIYEVMKNCSHRNFVSVGLSTGTYETICFGNIIGIFNLLLGLMVVLLQAFHPYRGSHTRWTCFYVFPLWQMGVALLLIGSQGMCFVMLSLAKRQTLPWERFEEEETPGSNQSESHGWFSRSKRFMSRTVAGDRHYRVEDQHLRRLQRMILLQCASGGIVAGLLGVLLFIFLPIWKETYHPHY